MRKILIKEQFAKFVLFATLTPQIQPRSKTTVAAVVLLRANAHAHDNVSEIDKKNSKV